MLDWFLPHLERVGVLKSGLCTGHTGPGINEAVLHSMDFLSHLPYIVSLDFVLYSVSRPFWLCPVRSTLLQYVLDSSSTCRLTQIVLGTDSASICSYSSLYLVSHALLHSHLLMRPLDLYIRRTFSAVALQSFAHRLKSKSLPYLCSMI